ncbi:unnamed protein product [Rotaria sp. Silwood2]|nr:unnamed protein product [Rotaria sp. Silwood2]CAF4548826.1 unnamed protein product [Rotaria sp. Silwood2]
MSFSFLPVIDLKSKPNNIRQSLLLAYSTIGFFYISNHGLNSLQSRMFSLTKEFFCLSHNEKRFYSPNTTSYQGYLKIGHENLDTTNSKLLDVKEGFAIRQSSLNNKDMLPNIFFHEKNFKLIEQSFRQCYDLCMRLLEYLAEIFQIDRDYFTLRHK